MVLQCQRQDQGAATTSRFADQGVELEDTVHDKCLGARVEASRAEGLRHQLVVEVPQGVQHQFAKAKQTLEGSSTCASAALAHHVVELDPDPDVDLVGVRL